MPLEPVTIVSVGLLVAIVAVERRMLADWPIVAVIVLVYFGGRW